MKKKKSVISFLVKVDKDVSSHRWIFSFLSLLFVWTMRWLSRWAECVLCFLCCCFLLFFFTLPLSPISTLLAHSVAAVWGRWRLQQRRGGRSIMTTAAAAAATHMVIVIIDAEQLLKGWCFGETVIELITHLHTLCSVFSSRFSLSLVSRLRRSLSLSLWSHI